MIRRNWTYDETLLAFNLYLQIPFAKITGSNPMIAMAAKTIGRTPAALAMKMCNLARFDKTLTEKGIVGLQHGAKIEQKIWDEFYRDNDALFDKINKVVTKEFDTIDDWIGYQSVDIPIGSSKEAVTKIRIGQQFFRRSVLSAYNFRCCITGICVPKFLIASHIKPWKSSAPNEKTDPHNGLCLNALHDRAFDQGLITIDEEYRVVVADKIKKNAELDQVTREFIVGSAGEKIMIPDKFEPYKKYLEYHRDVVFVH